MTQKNSIATLLFAVGGGFGILFLFAVLSSLHLFTIWLLAICSVLFLVFAYELGIPPRYK
jgi:hypothetical protein